MATKLPLVVIAGPTASGKTGLAIRLAQELGGEIISADSRAVYRGLDIGTAKPTLREQRLVQHWGIDIVEPSERFTAVDFQLYAKQKIDEIRSRGNIPFLVGGTGLYVDSVVFDYEFPGLRLDTEKRQALEKMSLEQLYKYCEDNNVRLPENSKNIRYVVNSIMRDGALLKRRTKPIDHSIVVGIATEKQTLRQRINDRAGIIFESNVVDEAVAVANKWGWDNQAMTGNIYPLIRRYLDGGLEYDQMIEEFRTADWQLAKRQLTWLNRNEYILWYDLENAYNYIAQRVADFR